MEEINFWFCYLEMISYIAYLQ